MFSISEKVFIATTDVMERRLLLILSTDNQDILNLSYVDAGYYVSPS